MFANKQQACAPCCIAPNLMPSSPSESVPRLRKGRTHSRVRTHQEVALQGLPQEWRLFRGNRRHGPFHAGMRAAGLC